MILGTILTVAMSGSGQMSMTMPAPDPKCQVSSTQAGAMLAAAYDDFDQKMSGQASWRTLMNAGCYSGAATMIVQYVESHAAQLTAEQIRTLHFHAGQVTALGGQDLASVPHFLQARDPTASAEWNAYVDATIAFLKQDRKALTSAREAYAKASKPDAPRLKVIDGLLSCLGRSYREGVAGCGAPVSR